MSNHDSLTYVADVAFEGDPTKIACSCGSCDWRGFASQLDAIEQAILTPGDSSPAGRCPIADCGALAYVDEQTEDVDVIERESLHQEAQGHFLPWLVQHANGDILQFENEEHACAYQRAWRLAHGMDAMTGERAVANTSPVGG